ncbi:hypothetical protein CSKR_111914 [Clonorchis sinensis]|uniref:Uncharacterized protein n=1 Tax=Clonorchis sinensis TaxID=79923 RepID=A0A3R7G6I7_CLOSI|nr:hypothetical protein CSKR_111914 [Clonorchis sinensis]
MSKHNSPKFPVKKNFGPEIENNGCSSREELYSHMNKFSEYKVTAELEQHIGKGNGVIHRSDQVSLQIVRSTSNQKSISTTAYTVKSGVDKIQRQHAGEKTSCWKTTVCVAEDMWVWASVLVHRVLKKPEMTILPPYPKRSVQTRSKYLVITIDWTYHDGDGCQPLTGKMIGVFGQQLFVFLNERRILMVIGGNIILSMFLSTYVKLANRNDAVLRSHRLERFHL